MKKVAIHSLGCKVNSYEAESMEIMLRDEGYEIVPFSEDVQADIYIINTCSVTICGCLCGQYLFRYQYGRPQVKTDAA